MATHPSVGVDTLSEELPDVPNAEKHDGDSKSTSKNVQNIDQTLASKEGNKDGRPLPTDDDLRNFRRRIDVRMEEIRQQRCLLFKELRKLEFVKNTPMEMVNYINSQRNLRRNIVASIQYGNSHLKTKWNPDEKIDASLDQNRRKNLPSGSFEHK